MNTRDFSAKLEFTEKLIKLQAGKNLDMARICATGRNRTSALGGFSPWAMAQIGGGGRPKRALGLVAGERRRGQRGRCPRSMQRKQTGELGAGVSRRWPAASGAWQGGDRGDKLEEVLGRLGCLARGEGNAGVRLLVRCRGLGGCVAAAEAEASPAAAGTAGSEQ